MTSYKNDKDQTVKIEFNKELPLTTVLAGKSLYILFNRN